MSTSSPRLAVIAQGFKSPQGWQAVHPPRADQECKSPCKHGWPAHVDCWLKPGYLGVPLLHVNALVLVAWHRLPDPHALVPAARRHQAAVGAPCHRFDLILMPLQHCHLSAWTGGPGQPLAGPCWCSRWSAVIATRHSFAQPARISLRIRAQPLFGALCGSRTSSSSSRTRRTHSLAFGGRPHAVIGHFDHDRVNGTLSHLPPNHLVHESENWASSFKRVKMERRLTCSQMPPCNSQIVTVASKLALARSLPFGDQHTLRTPAASRSGFRVKCWLPAHVANGVLARCGATLPACLCRTC